MCPMCLCVEKMCVNEELLIFSLHFFIFSAYLYILTLFFCKILFKSVISPYYLYFCR
jgi:hypothetical protein